MKDSNGVRDSVEEVVSSPKQSDPEISSPTPTFNKRRPKFLDPSVYLTPSLQNMFELCYFTNSKEMIPSGWMAVDEDKTYPSLSSRNPQVQQPVDNDSENGYEGSHSRAESESSDDNGYHGNAYSNTTRMTEETSEEEEDEDDVVAAPPKVSSIFRINLLHSRSLISNLLPTFCVTLSD